MIFCRVEQGYLPGGWLGVLTAKQTYIDFSGKFAFEDASGELLHRLASIEMSIKGEKAEVNVGPFRLNARLDPKINAFFNVVIHYTSKEGFFIPTFLVKFENSNLTG